MFIYYLFQGHLGYFQFYSIISKTFENIYMQVFFLDISSLGYKYEKCRISESQWRNLFGFMKTKCVPISKVFVILHIHQQRMRVSVVPDSHWQGTLSVFLNLALHWVWLPPIGTIFVWNNFFFSMHSISSGFYSYEHLVFMHCHKWFSFELLMILEVTKILLDAFLLLVHRS